MPQKTLLNIFHNRPDLVVFTPNMIYVCDLTICSITNLESAARLKWQRYYLDRSSEITTMIPFIEENKYANKPNICKHLRELYKLPCHFIPLVFSRFGEIDSKNLDRWQNFFKIFDMEGKKHIARISRRIAMESEFMLYKYFT
uniref:Uncharacterized protein n=1 Tax=Parastrongyloides trichosuri TaxID=131310 RepID=A0A0N5A0U2_PARTI